MLGPRLGKLQGRNEDIHRVHGIVANGAKPGSGKRRMARAKAQSFADSLPLMLLLPLLCYVVVLLLLLLLLLLICGCCCCCCRCCCC